MEEKEGNRLQNIHRPSTAAPPETSKQQVDLPSTAPVLRESRQPRRVQEKQSVVKSRKPTPPSSLFPSSASLTPNVGSTLPLSKTELSRLTSLHTRRNETFESQLETVVVRKRGENRPASPSSKIRRTVGNAGGVGKVPLTKEAAKEARERRARKRTPEIEEGGEEERLEDGIN